MRGSEPTHCGHSDQGNWGGLLGEVLAEILEAGETFSSHRKAWGLTKVVRTFQAKNSRYEVPKLCLSVIRNWWALGIPVSFNIGPNLMLLGEEGFSVTGQCH